MKCILIKRDQKLQTNPLIKIRFPSYLTSYKWTVEEKHKKLRYALSFPAILALAICIQTVRREALLHILLQKLQMDEKVIEALINSLISNDLILYANSKPSHFTQKKLLLDIWKKRGWNEAGDYHWFSWDFPFLDYSKGGAKKALSLMADFHQTEPDIQRVKTYLNHSYKINLPFPLCSITRLKKERCLRAENFLTCISLVFAKITDLTCTWSNVPLMRRTSPSGGCRHPTEGYALVVQVPELKEGWYHVQTEPPSLVFLNKPLTHKEFNYAFPEMQGKKWAAIIILTSIFERNMYRYREARTFRSIHMDAGHILATVEMIIKEQGFFSQISLNFCEKSIAQALSIHPLEEGIMACIGIALS